MNALRTAALVMLLSSTAILAACERKTEESATESQRVTWKMASSFSGTLPILGTGGHYFSERVSKITRGRMSIKFFDPGKLVPPLEVFDATSKGAVDAGWSAAGYWIGKIPAAAFFSSVPFGPDATEYLAWMFKGGGWELWKEIYGRSNIYPIPCMLIPPEASGWFREPITDVSQFDGMKIRFYGMGGQVMQKMGASVQLLAGADLYPALERGVLDATEFGMPVFDRQIGLHKITKHYYFPGWHQQSSLTELLINLDRWNELDEGDQALLETLCRDSIVEAVTIGETAQDEALDAIKAAGVTVHYWPDEILTAFKEAWDQVVVEMREQDADFKRVHDSYSAFRKEYEEWATLSRLPPAFK